MATNTVPRAAIWKLALPSSPQPAERTILPDDGQQSGGESIIGEDERTLVDFSDFQDGGKFRSIVKIQTRFEDPRTKEEVWGMGTGWLISPDVLVTAGHNVFDWGRNLGPATQIKTYVGYNGRKSLQTPSCQARYGLNVSTAAEWVESGKDRLRDVAFIQLDRPFTGNLRNFNFTSTPDSPERTILGVVGYPGDKALNSADGEEYGAQMYEEFSVSKLDIGSSPRKMIEYNISTYGGQSGAPVLRKSGGELTSIGTHCYVGDESNSGNSIMGRYGNNYQAFINLFNSQRSAFGTAKDINIVGGNDNSHTAGNSTGSTASTGHGNGYNSSPRNFIQENEVVNEESFFDVLRDVARIGPNFGTQKSSMLGPVGSYAGAVAGGLLGAIAAQTNGAAEGAYERAVLAEATLQAVLSLEYGPESSNVTNKIRSSWSRNAPNIDALAKVLAPALVESSLELLSYNLQTLARASSANRYETDNSFALLEPRPLRTEQIQIEHSFMEGMLGPTRPVAGIEERLDWLGPVLKTVFVDSKPIASPAAKAAIQRVNSNVAKNLNGNTPVCPGVSSRQEEATKLLIKRALMADMALEAVSTLRKDSLETVTLSQNPLSYHAEGIFDFIKTKVQQFGPKLIEVAKECGKGIIPNLALGAQVPSEQVPESVQKRGKKPSLMEMLQGNH